MRHGGRLGFNSGTSVNHLSKRVSFMNGKRKRYAGPINGRPRHRVQARGMAAIEVTTWNAKMQC